jgi:predicted DsbA family dithiol-disulfide isomerase
LVASSLEALRKEEDIDLYWHAFLLRPPGAPPMSAEKRAQIEAGRGRLEQMARTQYGLELHQGPAGIDSRPAHIAAKYAAAQGKGDAFHAKVMRAYWQEARSIEEPAVLQDIAAEVGLNREDFAAAWQNANAVAAMNAELEQAARYGLHAVPALIFDHKYLVSGAQPYPVLKRVIGQIREEEAATAQET